MALPDQSGGICRNCGEEFESPGCCVDQSARSWAHSPRGEAIDQELLEFLDEDDAMSVWPIIERHCIPKPVASDEVHQS